MIFNTKVHITKIWVLKLNPSNRRIETIHCFCLHFRVTENINKDRSYLDRRRFEDGFLLYLIQKVITEFRIEIPETITNRNALLDHLNERFYEEFLKKWASK